jgi:ankyrin repeat protein
MSLLHWAARCGQGEKVLDCLRGNDDLLAFDQDGLSAIECAALNGFTDVVLLLAQVYAQLGPVPKSARERHGPRTRMDGIHIMAAFGDAGMALNCLHHGQDLLALDENGLAPIERAALAGKTETVLALAGEYPRLAARVERLNRPADLRTHTAKPQARAACHSPFCLFPITQGSDGKMHTLQHEDCRARCGAGGRCGAKGKGS